MKKILKALQLMTACAVSVSSLGVLTAVAEVTPNPVIGRGCPAYSEANPATASAGNDEFYYTFWSGTSPDHLAYDLSSVPESQREKVIAVWYNTSSYDAIGSYQSRQNEPSDYTIEVNAADGGEYPTENWVVVDTVSDNTLSSRQHLVDMKGYNWIRMNISKGNGQEGGGVQVNFDIHNVTDGVSDSWILFGDSITAISMNNCYGTGYATFVNQLDSRYFPIQENGGIGGITSTDGRNNIDRWLSTSPAKYVSIAYGTNDAWGNQTGAEKYYENTKYMIDAIIAAGKIPVLPKIPYATEAGVADYLADYEAEIDRLYEEYGDKLVKGPDLETFFKENPTYLGGDGVHPSDTGTEALRKYWAETMYANVYTAEGTTEPTSEETDITYGDANGDGTVSVADPTLIMQSLANPNDYTISDEDKPAADVSGNGDGITADDALAIQKYLANGTPFDT